MSDMLNIVAGAAASAEADRKRRASLRPVPNTLAASSQRAVASQAGAGSFSSVMQQAGMPLRSVNASGVQAPNPRAQAYLREIQPSELLGPMLSFSRRNNRQVTDIPTLTGGTLNFVGAYRRFVLDVMGLQGEEAKEAMRALRSPRSPMFKRVRQAIESFSGDYRVSPNNPGTQAFLEEAGFAGGAALMSGNSVQGLASAPRDGFAGAMDTFGRAFVAASQPASTLAGGAMGAAGMDPISPETFSEGQRAALLGADIGANILMGMGAGSAARGIAGAAASGAARATAAGQGARAAGLSRIAGAATPSATRSPLMNAVGLTAANQAIGFGPQVLQQGFDISRVEGVSPQEGLMRAARDTGAFLVESVASLGNPFDWSGNQPSKKLMGALLVIGAISEGRGIQLANRARIANAHFDLTGRTLDARSTDALFRVAKEIEALPEGQRAGVSQAVNDLIEAKTPEQRMAAQSSLFGVLTEFTDQPLGAVDGFPVLGEFDRDSRAVRVAKEGVDPRKVQEVFRHEIEHVVENAAGLSPERLRETFSDAEIRGLQEQTYRDVAGDSRYGKTPEERVEAASYYSGLAKDESGNLVRAMDVEGDVRGKSLAEASGETEFVRYWIEQYLDNRGAMSSGIAAKIRRIFDKQPALEKLRKEIKSSGVEARGMLARMDGAAVGSMFGTAPSTALRAANEAVEQEADPAPALVQEAQVEEAPVQPVREPASATARKPKETPTPEDQPNLPGLSPSEQQGVTRAFMLGGNSGASASGRFPSTADVEVYNYAAQSRGRGSGRAGRGKTGPGLSGSDQRVRAMQNESALASRYGLPSEEFRARAREYYESTKAAAKKAGDGGEFRVESFEDFLYRRGEGDANKAQPRDPGAVKKRQRAIDIDVERRAPKPTGLSRVRSSAEAYARRAGIQYEPHEEYVQINEQNARAMAEFFDKAKDAPDDPRVVAAYDSMKPQLIEQARQMLEVDRVNVEKWTQDGQPYADSSEMVRDVAENNHLWFFPTEGGFGDENPDLSAMSHPLLEPAPITLPNGDSLLYNDVLRFVHDYYGHAKEGFQFGPRGEENAYLAHASMFTEDALLALANETKAQNNWVNFGPWKLEDGRGLFDESGSLIKKGDPRFIPLTERPYSDQKVAYIPEDLYLPSKLYGSKTQRSIDFSARGSSGETVNTVELDYSYAGGRLASQFPPLASAPEGARAEMARYVISEVANAAADVVNQAAAQSGMGSARVVSVDSGQGYWMGDFNPNAAVVMEGDLAAKKAIMSSISISLEQGGLFAAHADPKAGTPSKAIVLLKDLTRQELDDLSRAMQDSTGSGIGASRLESPSGPIWLFSGLEDPNIEALRDQLKVRYGESSYELAAIGTEYIEQDWKGDPSGRNYKAWANRLAGSRLERDLDLYERQKAPSVVRDAWNRFAPEVIREFGKGQGYVDFSARRSERQPDATPAPATTPASTPEAQVESQIPRSPVDNPGQEQATRSDDRSPGPDLQSAPTPREPGLPTQPAPTARGPERATNVPGDGVLGATSDRVLSGAGIKYKGRTYRSWDEARRVAGLMSELPLQDDLDRLNAEGRGHTDIDSARMIQEQADIQATMEEALSRLLDAEASGNVEAANMADSDLARANARLAELAGSWVDSGSNTARALASRRMLGATFVGDVARDIRRAESLIRRRMSKQERAVFTTDVQEIRALKRQVDADYASRVTKAKAAIKEAGLNIKKKITLADLVGCKK